MPHGIFDEYAWFEWAETLSADQPPSPDAIAEAERYAPRNRVCLHAWSRGGQLAPVASLARAFALGDAHAARERGLDVTHVRYLDTAALTEHHAFLRSIPGLIGLGIAGASAGLTPAESRALAGLAELSPLELDLEGVPRANDLAPLRPTLRRLALKLQDKPRATDLLAHPWPALRELRLCVGNAADMTALAERLPALATNLPACQSLDLDETATTAKVPLLEAMRASPWIAQLTTLRLHDYKLPADRLSVLAEVPFERLTHLGLGLVRVRPQVADVLARADALRTVQTLEIDAKIGARGLQQLVDAWPALTQIAVWEPPAETVDEIIEALGLEAFAARGGVVQRRVS